MQPFLVELEERLARDLDGAVRTEMAAGLARARRALAARLAQGGTPEQYTRWSAAERALGAALEVLSKVKIEPPSQALDGPAITLKGE